jgi:hypothetical protein
MTTLEEMAKSRRLNRMHWNQFIRAKIAFYREYLRKGFTGLAACMIDRIAEDMASRSVFRY